MLGKCVASKVMTNQKPTKAKAQKKSKPEGKGRGDADNQIHFSAINQELNAIKNDISVLSGETKKELALFRSETRTEFDSLHTEMTATSAATIRHFDVAVEQIRSLLIGASADRLSLLEGGKENHEARIITLEVHSGLRTE